MMSPGKFFGTHIGFCLVFLGLLAMLCVSFTWMVFARRTVDTLSEAINGLAVNWNYDMIYGLTLNSAYPLTDSSYYLTLWNGTWPGTVEGCYCSAANERSARSDPDSGVSEGLFDRSCSGNETHFGCGSIQETSSITTTKWSGNVQVYAIRKRDTNFLANYKNIRPGWIVQSWLH